MLAAKQDVRKATQHLLCFLPLCAASISRKEAEV